jgi:glutamate transport system substrate-binding protein
MRFIRTKAVIATVGLALSLAACGDAGDDGGETTDVEVQENAGDEFDDGTAMKEFADSGEITIGVKYDQPGIGFKGATDDMPVGFDPEIGKILKH